MTALTSRMMIFGALIGSLLPCPVLAETETDEMAVVSPKIAASSPFGSAAINDDALDTQRGGAEVQVLNKSALDGVVSDNQASYLNTGSNFVTDGSFAGANGHSTVIQNSGNNVLIQNSTIINLQVK